MHTLKNLVLCQITSLLYFFKISCPFQCQLREFREPLLSGDIARQSKGLRGPQRYCGRKRVKWTFEKSKMSRFGYWALKTCFNNVLSQFRNFWNNFLRLTLSLPKLCTFWNRVAAKLSNYSPDRVNFDNLLLPPDSILSTLGCSNISWKA